MDPSYIERVIATVGRSAAAAVGALSDVGLPLAASFIVLSIVLMGVSLMQGGVALSSIIRMTGAAAGTTWVLKEWQDIVLGTLNGARNAIGVVIPGYTGPSSLFRMATDIAGRIELEQVACGWDAWRCIGLAVLGGISGIIVWVGLAWAGLLATIAEFQLLIGAVAAPLILPALAFPLTSQLGWGVVHFVVKAGVRVVVMGVTSWVMADALAQTISVPGTDEGLTSEAIYSLIGLAVLTYMVSTYASSLANDLVGGGAGSLGYSAATATGSQLTQSAVTAASTAAKGVAAAPTAASATVSAASSAYRGASRAFERSSSGSPFQ